MLATVSFVKAALSMCAGMGMLTPCQLGGLADSGPLAEEWPINAKPGECYALVYVPPEYATETFAVVPFEYEGVEEVQGGQPASEFFLAQDRRPAHETFQIDVPWKSPRAAQMSMSADYRTVSRQRLVPAHTTRTAEYTEVERIIKVSEGRLLWKQVSCDNGDDLGV